MRIKIRSTKTILTMMVRAQHMSQKDTMTATRKDAARNYCRFCKGWESRTSWLSSTSGINACLATTQVSSTRMCWRGQKIYWQLCMQESLRQSSSSMSASSCKQLKATRNCWLSKMIVRKSQSAHKALCEEVKWSLALLTASTIFAIGFMKITRPSKAMELTWSQKFIHQTLFQISMLSAKETIALITSLAAMCLSLPNKDLITLTQDSRSLTDTTDTIASRRCSKGQSKMKKSLRLN